MILGTEKCPLWEGTDATSLRTFLESGTGVRMLQILAFNAPALLDGAHMNKTLVASGEVKGYTNALTALVSLTESRPVEAAPVDNYPPLDDEAAWTKPAPKTPSK